MDNIQNPGSALGEAIGHQMEIALNNYLQPLVEQYDCYLVSKGRPNAKSGKDAKLLLYDNFGTAYNIDAVVTNESMQPLILIEYKYIRYKKHNRDKGSWICTAHNALRHRYQSVRSSVAILAGNWSRSSTAMMVSQDINLFLIPFEKIVALLREHHVQFEWEEKDRNTAIESWYRYNQLTSRQKQQIAENMIQDIMPSLSVAIARVLDETTPRTVDKVAIEMHTNVGEVRRFEFKDLNAALDFLGDFNLDEMLDHKNSFTLFDKPKEIEE